MKRFQLYGAMTLLIFLAVFSVGCSTKEQPSTRNLENKITISDFTQKINNQLQTQNIIVDDDNWIQLKSSDKSDSYFLHIEQFGEKGGILAIVNSKTKIVDTFFFSSDKVDAGKMVDGNDEKGQDRSSDLSAVLPYIRIGLPALDANITPRRAEELLYGICGNFSASANSKCCYNNISFDFGVASNTGVTLSISFISPESKETWSNENPDKKIIQLDELYSPNLSEEEKALELAAEFITDSYSLCEAYRLDGTYDFLSANTFDPSDSRYNPMHQMRVIFQPPQNYSGIVYRLASKNENDPDYLVLETGEVFKQNGTVSGNVLINPLGTPIDCFAPINLSEIELGNRNLLLVTEINKQVSIMENMESFAIVGDIKSVNSDGSLNIRGMAQPSNNNWRTTGALYEQSNIKVNNPNQSCIVGGVYYGGGKHGFIRQATGENRFGGSVPVYIYGDMPASYVGAQMKYDFLSSVIKAMKNSSTSENNASDNDNNHSSNSGYQDLHCSQNMWLEEDYLTVNGIKVKKAENDTLDFLINYQAKDTYQVSLFNNEDTLSENILMSPDKTQISFKCSASALQGRDSLSLGFKCADGSFGGGSYDIVDMILIKELCEDSQNNAVSSSNDNSDISIEQSLNEAEPEKEPLLFTVQEDSDQSILSAIEIESIYAIKESNGYQLTINYGSNYSTLFSLSDSPDFNPSEMTISEVSLYLDKGCSSYTFKLPSVILERAQQLTLEATLDISNNPMAMEIYKQGTVAIRFDIQL